MPELLESVEFATVAHVLEHLGHIDPARVLLRPTPGTATVDALLHERRRGRRPELVDGILVTKEPMGYFEGRLAFVLGFLLEAWMDTHHDVGVANGADAMMRLTGGNVRVPDVSLVLWEQFEDRRIPDVPVPSLHPDLAVEVLSLGNTPAEMERKRHDYFDSGTALVWEITPPSRTITVYSSPSEGVVKFANETVDGGDVLPGFEITFAELEARAQRRTGHQENPGA